MQSVAFFKTTLWGPTFPLMGSPARPREPRGDPGEGPARRRFKDHVIPFKAGRGQFALFADLTARNPTLRI